MRLDVPHFRMMDSAAVADFDLLAGTIVAGDSALVVKGFQILSPAAAVGSPATSLQLNVAGGTVLHSQASEHGTIYSVPTTASVETLSSTNPNVSGSFSANQPNFIGLDLRKSADSTTSDLAFFLSANTLVETPKTVPLARTMGYKIIISTTDFSATPHILPIAKVTTGTANTVVAIQDCRQMAFRLGSGGSAPDRYHAFPWATGRLENTTGDIFSGGDKSISSLKDSLDAIMTRCWELGGGQYWYSPTSDREVKLIMGQPVILSTGDNFAWTLGSSTLQWASLSVVFANSPVSSNSITDGTAVLADGQCLYVDIDRSQVASLVPQVGTLTTLGTPVRPGSRYVIAWRVGSYIFTKEKAFEVNRVIPVANTVAYGTVRLKYVAGTPSDPTVLAQDTNGTYNNVANSGNAPAFFGTGNGTGSGLKGLGGASGGAGVEGTGGTGNGIGVKGQGTGTAPGGQFNAASGSYAALKITTGFGDLPIIDSAAGISIGTSTSTGVTIGRLGMPTILAGDVDAYSIDHSAGTLNLGTTATTVYVGASSTTTYIGYQYGFSGHSIVIGGSAATIDLGGNWHVDSVGRFVGTGGKEMTGLVDPTISSGAANKNYVDNTIASSIAANNLTFAAANATPRNRVINSGMHFWQRGTSTPLTTGKVYLADRWYAFHGAASPQGTNAQVSNALFSFNCFTRGTSDSGTATRYIVQEIELESVAALVQQNATMPITVSGLIYTNGTATGTAGIMVCSNTANNDFIAAGSIPFGTFIPSTPLVVVNGVMGSTTLVTATIAAGTLSSSTNRIQVALYWSPSGGAPASVAQVGVTNVQLVAGANAFAAGQNLAESTIANEFVACQRYYEKSYDSNIAPGTAGYNDFATTAVVRAYTAVSLLVMGSYPKFAVEKRSVPTVTLYYDSTAGSWRFGGSARAATVTSPSRKGFYVTTTGAVTLTGDGDVQGAWTADCEL